jgi:hypothetical protein
MTSNVNSMGWHAFRRHGVAPCKLSESRSGTCPVHHQTRKRIHMPFLSRKAQDRLVHLALISSHHQCLPGPKRNIRSYVPLRSPPVPPSISFKIKGTVLIPGSYSVQRLVGPNDGPLKFTVGASLQFSGKECTIMHLFIYRGM